MKSERVVNLNKNMRHEMALRDKEANIYDKSYISTKGLWWHETEVKLVLSLLDLKPTDTVLDAGCGTGRISVEIAPYVGALYGVDFSSASVELLLKRAAEADLSNLKALVGDMTCLAFDSDKYDKIISVQVIEHIPSHKLRMQGLREVLRVLKPGGKFVFPVYRWGGMITQNKEGYWDNGLYRYAFTAKSHKSYRMMYGAGYVDIEVIRLINNSGVTQAGALDIRH